ncbi:MAG: four helix bundle protein [Bacteroidota bacterium]
MQETKRKYDLEERLIDFAVIISKIVNMLPSSRVGAYLSGQLVRSGLSSALHYGEAQGAESRSDFVHKCKVVLKELRETGIALKVIRRLSLIRTEILESAQKETYELIAIFAKSISTAGRNLKKV